MISGFKRFGVGALTLASVVGGVTPIIMQDNSTAIAADTGVENLPNIDSVISGGEKSPVMLARGFYDDDSTTSKKKGGGGLYDDGSNTPKSSKRGGGGLYDDGSFSRRSRKRHDFPDIVIPIPIPVIPDIPDIPEYGETSSMALSLQLDSYIRENRRDGNGFDEGKALRNLPSRITPSQFLALKSVFNNARYNNDVIEDDIFEKICYTPINQNQADVIHHIMQNAREENDFDENRALLAVIRGPMTGRPLSSSKADILKNIFDNAGHFNGIDDTERFLNTLDY